MSKPTPAIEVDWLAFTDGEYYHRVRAIMLKAGMGEGDVEMILANVWEAGWLAEKGTNPAGVIERSIQFMTITYNGRHKETGHYKKLTYDEVIVLGFGPTDRDAVHTITYFHPKGPEGSLQRGETLKLKRGMSITCVQTNRA